MVTVPERIYRYINQRIDEEFRRRGFVGATLDGAHVGGVLPPGQVAMRHDDLTDVAPDQHHDQAHSGTGADHTYSGLTPGHILTATSPTGVAFQPNTGAGVTSHDLLTDVSADDHHAQAHAHSGADGSGTVAHSALTGVSANQHHNQAHAGDGADHTYSGLTVGQVYTATGATTAAFQTPTAPAMVKIAETTLAASAASITFSSIPGTYRNLLVVGVARSDGAAAVYVLAMRLNGRTDAIYDAQVGNFGGTSATASETIAGTFMSAGVATGSTAAAGEFGANEMTLLNYANTSQGKVCLSTYGRKQANSAGNVFVSQAATFCRNTAAVTSLELFATTGNLVSGSSFTLYGLT